MHHRYSWNVIRICLNVFLLKSNCRIYVSFFNLNIPHWSYLLIAKLQASSVADSVVCFRVHKNATKFAKFVFSKSSLVLNINIIFLYYPYSIIAGLL